jgi:hypothetical protein
MGMRRANRAALEPWLSVRNGRLRAAGCVELAAYGETERDEDDGDDIDAGIGRNRVCGEEKQRQEPVRFLCLGSAYNFSNELVRLVTRMYFVRGDFAPAMTLPEAGGWMRTRWMPSRALSFSRPVPSRDVISSRAAAACKPSRPNDVKALTRMRSTQNPMRPSSRQSDIPPVCLRGGMESAVRRASQPCHCTNGVRAFRRNHLFRILPSPSAHPHAPTFHVFPYNSFPLPASSGRC